MTAVVEAAASSSTSSTRHSVVVVVTGEDEVLKAHIQTRTMPCRVLDQMFGTVRRQARGK